MPGPAHHLLVKLAPILTLLLAVTGCAGMPMTQTGFLDNYDELEPAPERTVAFVPDGIELYTNERLCSGEPYDAVLVEPVVYRPADDNDHEPSPERADDLSRYFTRKLKHTLGEDFELVDTPRPGAARVRATITALDPSNVPINVVTLILLFPVDMGGVSGEIEIVDSVTEERLAAMTLCREGTPFLLIECFNRYGHARHSMKKWAKEVRRILKNETDS